MARTINRKKLLSTLLKVKVAKQIGLTYRKLQTVIGVGDVIVETRVVGYINSDYARAYKRKVGKSIKPMKRSWGARIEGTPIVEHNDSHYLSVKVIRKSPPLFYLNGFEITDPSTINKILATRKKDRDEVLMIRDYSLENISRLTLSGQVFNIR